MSKARVLVVEPHEECRSLVQDVLEVAGYRTAEIAAAGDAREAAARVGAGGVEVVVTSVLGDTGQANDLLESLKTASPEPVLVVLYSDLRPEKVSACRDLGFGHLVSKMRLLPELLGILQKPV